MAKIGFIRHGCTHWNKIGKAQGHSDIPLCEEGLEQAKKLADRMEGEKWNVIYSSDLQRARQTAEAIATRKNMTVHLDTRLRERYGGQIEGTTLEERIEKWGEQWRERDLGIETGEEISQRGMACLEEVMTSHPNENILVVSHGAFIKQMLRTMFPKTNVEQSLGNCSVTIVQFKDDTRELTLHNCLKHIDKN